MKLHRTSCRYLQRTTQIHTLKFECRCHFGFCLSLASHFSNIFVFFSFQLFYEFSLVVILVYIVDSCQYRSGILNITLATGLLIAHVNSCRVTQRMNPTNLVSDSSKFKQTSLIIEVKFTFVINRDWVKQGIFFGNVPIQRTFEQSITGYFI